MNIKRNLLALLMLCLVFASPVHAITIDPEPKKEKTAELTEEQKARLETIKNRVNEIKAMDKSNLTRAERKALKEELKGLKKEAKVISGGVYLSVGAIIIIILLLILLL
jgi:DNA gyrase/topoisomerase IV subunit A